MAKTLLNVSTFVFDVPLSVSGQSFCQQNLPWSVNLFYDKP